MRVSEMQASPLFMMALGSIRGMAVVEIGVVEEDGRRLAAQLEADPLEVGPAGGPDLTAGRRRPGERHLVHARVIDQVLADLATGRDHAEDALGQAGIGEDLGQEVGVEGRLRSRLEHHRAARQQGRGQLGAGQKERHVPGGDGGDHADRLLRHHDRPEEPVLDRVEGEGGPQPGVVVEDHGGGQHLGHQGPTTPASPSRWRSVRRCPACRCGWRRPPWSGWRRARPGPCGATGPWSKASRADGHGPVDVGVLGLGDPSDHLLGGG